MRPFKFRAEAALEMRRRQDQEARQSLASANRSLRESEAAAADAVRAVATAMEQARAAEASATDVSSRTWHRNWITRQQAEVARCQHKVTEHRTDVQEASVRAQQARRRLRSLERLRTRMLRNYLLMARRTEQKELDRLGIVRYVFSSRLGTLDTGYAAEGDVHRDHQSDK